LQIDGSKNKVRFSGKGFFSMKVNFFLINFCILGFMSCTDLPEGMPASQGEPMAQIRACWESFGVQG